MTFVYTALNADGQQIEGRVNASNRGDALTQLESRQLTPLSIVPDKEKGSWKLEFSIGGKRVSRRERDTFVRQLSTLLEAGIPLSEALKTLADEAPSQYTGEQWQHLYNDVINGASLAESMSHYPDIFPHIYVAMVRAGETGGFLDLVLEHIADFQEKEEELRSQFINAMTYPVVLVGLAISVLTFMLIYFIPKFKDIFAGFDAALPPLTTAIVNLGMFTKHYGLFIAIAIAIAIWRLSTWLKTDAGQRQKEAFLLKIPILNVLISRFALTRFCHMLGALIDAGVPLLTALRVARESVGIQTLVDTLGDAADMMQDGSRLADALAQCPELFPRHVIQVLAVAEQSGKLDKELIRLGTRTEKELQRRLKTATTLVEPVLLFIMAFIVGLIVIGMVLPIFTLQDYIK